MRRKIFSFFQRLLESFRFGLFKKKENISVYVEKIESERENVVLYNIIYVLLNERVRERERERDKMVF